MSEQTPVFAAPPFSTTTRFAVNALIHVGVLFLALMVLWILVISGTEQEALEGEFKNEIENGLRQSLDSGNVSSNGELKKQMQVIAPTLQAIRPLFTDDDPSSKTYNNSLLILGHH